MMKKPMYKIKNKTNHTVTDTVKMTKDSLIYCSNTAVQLQIQFLKQLQKPFVERSMAVKTWRSTTLREILKCLKNLAVISLDRCKKNQACQCH